jgi:hypothetical protein
VSLLLIEPGDIVAGQLFGGIERYNVPSVCLDAVSGQPRNDAIDFIAVFTVDAGLHNLARSLPIELPIPLGGVFIERPGNPQEVLNLRREQITMLVAYLGRRSLEMDIYPTVALETIAARQLVSDRRCRPSPAVVPGNRN